MHENGWSKSRQVDGPKIFMTYRLWVKTDGVKVDSPKISKG